MLTYWAMKLFPVSVPMVHMLDQPRLDPQRSKQLFQRRIRHAHAGSGNSDARIHPVQHRKPGNAGGLVNPLPRTEHVLKHGRQAYRNYCSVCHGILGNGAPTLTAAYGAKPANLVSQNMIELPDGKIYHVIMTGKNAMPSYAADLARERTLGRGALCARAAESIECKGRRHQMNDELRMTN